MIVYKVTNLINGKIYIGQTINTLEYRKNQHFREAKSKRKNTVYFHNALLKYGFENFVFEEIDNADTQEELNLKEQKWIAYYLSDNRKYGYNLDSGGKSGGCKSSSTKEKIGASSKERWGNPLSASKMLDGLKKGTEIWKQQCQEKRVAFKCPYCGKIELLPKWEAEHKKYCSIECRKKHGEYKDTASKASQIAAEKAHEKNLADKENIGKFILEWSNAHKDLIDSCPLNKISSTLEPLMQEIEAKYQIKDIRSLFICFNVKNKKEFVRYLQSNL